MKKLIKDLNKIKTKIQNSEKFKLNIKIMLPLIKHISNSSLEITEEIKMIINTESLKIKELKSLRFKDYSPVSEKIDEFLSSFTDEALNLLPADIDIQAIEYLLYELLVNVYKHSKFDNAYLQIINQKNNPDIEICIFDNGIGIPGSFKEASMSSENDCEAIFEAINGKTSDKEKYGLHGRGLNSSSRLTTLGFDGEMIIASGEGICVITKEGARPYFNSHEIKGTFVILRIKNKNIDDIYKYLEHQKISKVEAND